MKLSIALFFLFSLFPQNEIPAQPDLWEIYTVSDQPFINVVVEKYEADSLYIKSTDKIFAFHQDSIKYLIRRKEPNFGMGFIFGSIAGGILTAAQTSGSHGLFSEMGKGISVVIGVLIGGTIGGIIGLASGTDQKYNLEKLEPDVKTRLLKKLFE